jgi:hypothetical protein
MKPLFPLKSKIIIKNKNIKEQLKPPTDGLRQSFEPD